MATKPRAAKDVKAGSSRAEFLEKAKARKPRPTKIEPGSLREKALKRPNKTGVPGTSTESRRISDVKKSRGPFGQLVPRKENMPAVKKEPSRAVVKRSESSRAVTQYKKPSTGVSRIEAPKAGGSGIGSTIAKGLYRTVGGPAIMLVSMTTPAGEGSDNPSGPLMKGGKQLGYKYLPDRGGGPVKRQGSSSPSIASPKTDREVPKQPKAADFRKKNLEANRKVGQPKTANPKPLTPTAPQKPAFKGNWVGAAPTAMQARGGAKIKRSSFADLLKKR